MVRHLGSELRITLRPGATRNNSRMDCFNIRDLEVQNGIATDSACTLRRAEHDTHTACVQKCELGTCTEQELQFQNVPVKCEGFPDVTDCNRNLPYGRNVG